MEDRPSRRTFLGAVGLGCAAPVLLGAPVAEAARRVFPKLTRSAIPDPVLEQLRVQTLRQYRQAHAAVTATGRVPGEQLRATAANIALLRAHLMGHGQDGKLDEALRERLHRDGRGATIAALLEGYGSVRREIEAREDIVLPEEPDAVRAGAALDVLVRAGFARVTGVAARWAESQGRRRADTASLAFAARPASLGQKAGEDFYGWPMDETPPNFSCGDVTILLDALALLAAVAFYIDPPLCGVLGVIFGVLNLVKDIACTRAT